MRSPNMVEILKAFRVRERNVLITESELYTTFDILYNILALKRTLIYLSAEHPEIWISNYDWDLIETIVKFKNINF